MLREKVWSSTNVRMDQCHKRGVDTFTAWGQVPAVVLHPVSPTICVWNQNHKDPFVCQVYGSVTFLVHVITSCDYVMSRGPVARDAVLRTKNQRDKDSVFYSSEGGIDDLEK